MRALSIAVAGSVLGTSLVAGVGGETTIGNHLGEVESTIDTATDTRDVDVKGELLVEGLEHLVGGVGRHEVDTRSNVGASLELEGQGIARGRDTVRLRVLGTIDGAVGSASRCVWAERGIPGVSGVAVGIARGGMEPAPVSVEDDGTGNVGAATARGALGPAHGRVDLSLLSADLLGIGDGKDRRSEETGAKHSDCDL